MPLAFSNSLRSLKTDTNRVALRGIVGATLALSLWLSWFFGAEIPIYETTSDAQLEVAGAIHSVDAPDSGRLVQMDIKVGQEVKEGEPLARLDSHREDSRVQEGLALRGGLREAATTLNSARQAETESASSQRSADYQSIESAKARLQNVRSSYRFAQAELNRTEQLANSGLASDSALQEKKEEAEQGLAQIKSAENELALKQFELNQHWSAFEARLALYDQQIAELAAEILQNQATSTRLDQEQANRVIRAPIGGRIGEITPLRAGSWLEEGDSVANIIPQGEKIVVAEFSGAFALGRIRPGQPATLRLDAFPWIQYGQIEARVLRMGSETENHTMRVELELVEVPEELEPEHGLSGTVSVTVERISPANLVFRTVGHQLR